MKNKDIEINELKNKIADMSSEFNRMLKETYDKMQDRIQLANETWEQEGELPMVKRLEEFKTNV